MKKEIVRELIDYFKNENPRYNNISIPNSYEEQRALLRGLINIREPIYISNEILKKEDTLLQLELEEKGITDINNLKEIDDNIILWLGDITTINSDVIVNAGNNDGLGCFNPTHLCIDNTIHTFAGIRLRLECNEILKGGKIEDGEIIVCDSYNLPCKKIITTVGAQIINQVRKEDEETLANCYKNSLIYAYENGYKSICFPSISTGLFGYPISKAKYVAYNTVKEFLSTHDIKVIFNVYSKEDYDEYRSLFTS